MAALASWRAGMRYADELEAQVEAQQSRVQTLNTMLDSQRNEIGALKTERDLLHRQVELQLASMNEYAAEREGLPPKDHREFQQLARRGALEGELKALTEKAKQSGQRVAELERALSEQEAREAEATETLRAELQRVLGVALPWTGADLIEQLSLGPGTTRNEGIIRLSAESVRSHALFGPCLRLPPGTYEVCVALRMKPCGLERPVAVLELAWNVDDILGLRRIEGARLREQSFILRQTFSISPEQTAAEGPGLEIRLWTDLIASGEVSVAYIRKNVIVDRAVV
jgi:hypothetical protein